MNDQLPEKAARISSLIVKHLRDELPVQEMQELHRWINEKEDSYTLFEDCLDPARLIADLKELCKFHWLQAFGRFNSQR